MNRNAKNTPFFENLDALRFFAFFSVFLSHSILHYTNEIDFINSNFSLNTFVEFIGSGDKAVSFFFVLSGFLITYLILFEKKSTGKFSVKNFYMRRFLRIWPLYFLTVLIGFVLYPQLKSIAFDMETFQPHNWIYHISFLSNFDLVNLYNSNVGTDILMLVINWSLSVEEQFYIIWPLIFLVFSKKNYLKIFGLVVLVSVAYRFLYLENNIALKYNTFAVMSDLAIGGIIAYYSFFSDRFTGFFKALKRHWIILIYLAGLSLLIFEHELFPITEYQIVKRLLWSSFFAFVILEQNYGDYSLIKFKQLKLISKWGKYTYGLYLLHPLALQVVISVQKLVDFESVSLWMKIMFDLIGFILTLGFAYFSYHLFEKHFLKLKKRFYTTSK